MSYVMSLPWGEFRDLLTTAAEQRRRAEVRQEWLALLPWMSKDNFVGFDEYYRQRVVTPLTGPRKSKEELLAEAQRIRQAAKRQTA